MSEPEYSWCVLDRRVLIVAKANPGVGDWAAYIGSVAGVDYEREYVEVARRGTKVSLWIAEGLFPGFATKYQWRD